MSRNITTQVTIERLATELKNKFATTNAQVAQSFKSLKVDGNTVSFYTSTDKTGTAAAIVDFPAEYFLDQTKTTLVPTFTWSDTTYPGSTDPGLDTKPVLVLAVKGDGDSVNYSFLNMEKLLNIYTAKTEGKDSSTTITIDGYKIEVAVNISHEAGNALTQKSDGLYVASPKVTGAVSGNLAGLAADGGLTDSGVAGSKVITEDDITDYTAEQIAALLSDTPAQG